ncbi:MAG: hypothetical protein UR26_C0002G0236 [candidate division TM6 bacterium GW2011_GWF2_32_72]|nr:MAG: hypothetical protein UR26_C0002G0236 [candidate division TM6 bacterium GW2011_GWF2_32_72]
MYEFILLHSKCFLLRRLSKKSWMNIKVFDFANVFLRYKTYLIFLFFSIFSTPTYTLVVGSNSAVSLQSGLVIFPAVDLNNEILGFASLDNGFLLQNNLTTCTYNAFFPVNNSIYLNKGILYLSTNLTANITTLTLGNIDGQGHSLSLAESFTAFIGDATSSFTFTNLDLNVKSPTLSLDRSVYFLGNNSLVGEYTVFDLKNSGSLILGSGASLLLKNLTIKNFSSSDITCLDSSATITFQDVTLSMDGDYAFLNGKFDVIGNLRIQGEHTFVYHTDQVSTITSESQIFLDRGVTFSYDPTNNNRDLIRMVDSTSALSLNGATLYSTSTGIRLTKGRLKIKAESIIFAEGINETEGISLGDGITSNNLTIDSLADLYVDGWVDFKGIN